MRVSSPFKSSPSKAKQSRFKDEDGCFTHRLPETPPNPVRNYYIMDTDISPFPDKKTLTRKVTQPPGRKRFSPIKTRTSKKQLAQQQHPLCPTPAAAAITQPRSRKSSSSYRRPLLSHQQSRTASSSTTHHHRIYLPESISFTHQRQNTLCAEDEDEDDDDEEQAEEEPSPCVEIVSRKATAKKLGLASRVRRRLQFATAASAMSSPKGWMAPNKRKKKDGKESMRKGFQRLGTAEGSPEDVFRDYLREGLVCGS
ncbi:uncharacterized protein BO66DRAFT_397762 [Aspergillus aculeatinus CBS 121060]|uniref:Uncharacterized protein n=1 Tax=Aspergillus aculeatinus CBS 121060 TaxID=1448322 RepID=A0ACD1HLN3_9EURO|nr:hypothetical protein BO66DRAFT_397762 [Aspergillus aculeatinus CBS 121060]RAH74510.1 hypothetical protein BO66DRAFT_397762 [Aspergillus aculeatinus CBS 121060]